MNKISLCSCTQYLFLVIRPITIVRVAVWREVWYGVNAWALDGFMLGRLMAGETSVRARAAER